MFLGGIALAEVLTAASRAILHFVGKGVTLVSWLPVLAACVLAACPGCLSWLPVLAGIGLTALGLSSDIKCACGWKQRAWRLAIFKANLGVVGPVLVYFCGFVLDFPEGYMFGK